MLHAQLRKRIPEIAALFRRNRVNKAYLFGSAATGQLKKDSDVDFLVVFEEGLTPKAYADHFWELYTELPKIVERQVDLITEANLHNPFFIEELNETRILIYDEASEEIPV